MKLGIGILIFNPLDDKFHLERIKTSLDSFIKAINKSKIDVKLEILLNNSFIEYVNLYGIGNKTKELVFGYNKYDFINIVEDCWNNSMCIGYNKLFKSLHSDKSVDFISIFADDYIVPTNWVNIIVSEFKENNADFIMPSTSYVTHKNLLVPFKEPKHWNLDIRDNIKVGVKNGVNIDDINNISDSLQNLKTIDYMPTASFESTIFKREILDKFGYLDDRYFSLFWNQEYITKLFMNGVKGKISRKAFVFHYGKGGTTALFNKIGDEKHENSPFEKYLKSDVDLYNQKNCNKVSYWWLDKTNSSKKEKALEFNDIVKLIDFYNNKSFIVLKLKLIIKNSFCKFKKWFNYDNS